VRGKEQHQSGSQQAERASEIARDTGSGAGDIFEAVYNALEQGGKTKKQQRQQYPLGPGPDALITAIKSPNSAQGNQSQKRPGDYQTSVYRLAGVDAADQRIRRRAKAENADDDQENAGEQRAGGVHQREGVIAQIIPNTVDGLRSDAQRCP